MSKDNIVKDKKLIPTNTLYGVSPIIFKEMNYIDVCYLKIKLANKIVENELKINYMERDNLKIMKCTDAIQHQELLLKEMGMTPIKNKLK